MNNLAGLDIDRYHVIKQLGRGGMAEVYKAMDNRLERYVALKVIRLDAFAPMVVKHVLKRFEREAKSLARLNHPHIVSVHDFGTFDGEPYLVMEFLAGGTLKALVGKPISSQKVAQILAPVARALAYAHSNGIIHRDVKPANILLTANGEPKLSDFGVAKILDLDDGLTLTGANVGIGTPEYMAPEQWENKISPQTDIYSLGVVLYELVTGRKPYTADTPAAILIKQLTSPLLDPRYWVGDVPEAMEKVIYKALAKNPVERFASMAEFAAALERISTAAVGDLVGEQPVRDHAVGMGADLTMDPVTGQAGRISAPPKRAGLPGWAWWSGGAIGLVLAALIGLNAIGKLLPNLPVPAATPIVEASAPVVQASAPAGISTSAATLTPTQKQTIAALGVVPAATVDPDQKLLFHADFNDGNRVGFRFFDGNWAVVDDGTGNKVLEQNNRTTQFSEWSNSRFYTGFIDGIISFRFRSLVKHRDNDAVVLFFREQAEAERTYQVSYFPRTGQTKIGYQENGNEPGLMERASQPKKYPYQEGSWVTMRLVVQGEAVRVYLDDQLIVTTRDARIQSGDLMILTSPSQIIQFDDFNVWTTKPE